MGNYMSCTLTGPVMLKSSRAARVILPGGQIRQFRSPVKAAEVMLESPSFFLVNSQSLQIGRRFSALSADEDLEFGNVYLMFPMKRVNSVVMAADVAVLFMAASSAARRISGGSARIWSESDGKVTAVATESDAGGARLSIDEIAPEFKYRLSVCRSRKPSLETIKEEPIRSR